MGNNNVTINCSATGNYNDPGATVVDAYDPTAGPVYAPSLPLSNAGTHTLKYSYTNQNNKIAKKTRTVTIKSVEPIITVVGGTAPRIIVIGSPFVAPNATASDACEGGTLNVTVTSTVVPTIAGAYTVTYAATSIAGISASKVVTVMVKVPYIDPSGASNPDIASNQIPIFYDSVDSKWKKADVTNLNNTYKWYDYSNKMWANAVTVTNSTRSVYQSAALGTPILETDILTYMVWLPKYKYRIPAGSGARTIDIAFEGSTATKSTGDAITSYRTHPAFTFGTTELNGIWMGKYELTGTIEAITTKPGITSLRNQSISSFFTAIRNMENASNPYGYVANEVDTHMIKNNEWGAAAYLSHSIYGKNAEVTMNTNSSYITGDPGPQASTTGNVYGIYDMSGGAWDYVMGNYKNTPSSSGISFPIGSEYYNLYTTTNATTACNGGICYGEALSETANWYNDYAYFVETSFPWLMRGGSCDGGANAGVFGSYNYDGNSIDDVSSRACQTKS